MTDQLLKDLERFVNKERPTNCMTCKAVEALGERFAPVLAAYRQGQITAKDVGELLTEHSGVPVSRYSSQRHFKENHKV